MKINIICDQLDLGLFKFIGFISSEKDLYVENILLAPKSELHEKRKEQIRNKEIVFQKKSTLGYQLFRILKLSQEAMKSLFKEQLLN